MDFLNNISPGEDGTEGEVFFGLFDRSIRFMVEGSADLAYVKKCAAYLNGLTPEVIAELCLASIRYCNDFLSLVGEPEKSFARPADVLLLIDPVTLLVPEPEDGDEPVVHLELNCEWEEEHGLEWLVRNNRVLYVGAFQGVNPWRDFSAKESWNYA